jgi:hypothetical protein
MTDVTVGVAIRRSTVRARNGAPRTLPPMPGTWSQVESRPPLFGLHGDERRARAWLWRHFGVTAYAGSGGAA